MATALLVGNDINNIVQGYDWAQLLKDLIQFVGAERDIEPLSQQFPLFYEAIVAYSSNKKIREEREIKAFIAEKVRRLQPNSFHRALVTLGANELLTTNYDFTLERANNSDFPDPVNAGVVAESRYS